MIGLLSLPPSIIERGLLPFLSWKDTLTAELTCKAFRNILLPTKPRRKNEYLLSEIFLIENPRKEELLEALQNSKNALYFIDTDDEPWTVNKVANLEEGIRSLDQNYWHALYFVWRDPIPNPWIRNTQLNLEVSYKVTKKLPCSVANCHQLCIETEYTRLCDEHLEKRYEQDPFLKMKLLSRYGNGIGKNIYDPDQKRVAKYLANPKSEFPFRLKNVIFAYIYFAGNGFSMRGLFVGETIHNR
jgi:hypothetical protein